MIVPSHAADAMVQMAPGRRGARRAFDGEPITIAIAVIGLIAAGVSAATGVTLAVVNANIRAAEREQETQQWRAQIEEAERQRATQERIAIAQAAAKAKQQKTLLYLGGGAIGLGALYLIFR